MNDPTHDDVPYISFARAFQPDRPDAGQQADALVQEMAATRLTWRTYSADWVKDMLWSVRDQVADKAAFKTLVMQVFEGDWAHARFSDIMHALGVADAGSLANRSALVDLQVLFNGIDNLMLVPQGRIDEVLAQTDALLVGLSPGALDYLVGATKDRDSARVLWRFVLTHRTADQQARLLRLFRRVSIPDYEFENYFGSQAPRLIAGPQDAVFGACVQVLGWPAEAYDSDGAQSSAPESVCALLRPVAHQPGIFERLMALLASGTLTADLSDLVLKNLFLWKYSGPCNPTGALDCSQVELLLDTCLAHIRRQPDNFYWAMRVIGACQNPHAAGWIKKTLADQALFQSLQHHRGRFDSVADEMKEALEDAQDELRG
ncbi:hypothetical protein [Ottowia sp.]|uniref:hypothetical protein n=1 Tax=Ottowia sp. TaxID=1898956 RepID=UPI003A86A580